MKRLRHLLYWVRDAVAGGVILFVCLVVAFWDTVVMGRSLHEQEGDLR